MNTGLAREVRTRLGKASKSRYRDANQTYLNQWFIFGITFKT